MRTLGFFLLWVVVYGIGIVLPPVAAGYFWSVAFFAFGIYCVVNFARCREVHCLITAPGYFLVSLIALLKTWASLSLSWSTIWIAAVVITGVAYLIQYGYALSSGSSSLQKP